MAWCRLAGKLMRDRRGATAIEYGLIVALVVMAVMLAIAALGQANYEIWSNVASKVIKASNPG